MTFLELWALRVGNMVYNGNSTSAVIEKPFPFIAIIESEYPVTDTLGWRLKRKPLREIGRLVAGDTIKHPKLNTTATVIGAHGKEGFVQVQDRRIISCFNLGRWECSLQTFTEESTDAN